MDVVDFLARFAPIVGALAAFGAFVLSLLNRRKIQAVHVELNGRLSQLLEAARREGITNAALARAEGTAAGEQSQRDRQAPAEPQ